MKWKYQEEYQRVDWIDLLERVRSIEYIWFTVLHRYRECGNIHWNYRLIEIELFRRKSIQSLRINSTSSTISDIGGIGDK